METMSEEELKTILGNLAKTMDGLGKTVAEIGKEHKKTELAQQKTELAQQKTEAIIVSLAEEHKKTELAQQKTEAAQQKTEAIIVSLAEEHKKTELSMRELQKELGGVGNTQGEIAEDLFRRNIPGILEKKGIAIEEVLFNLRTPETEFDLVALNGKELVLTEIKTRLRLSDIEKFVNKQIPNFKEYFGKRYEGRKIIGALASLAIDAELEKEVEKTGLYLFTQTKEGGASLVNSPNFKPKFY